MENHETEFDPMTLATTNRDINSVVNGLRRVGWVFSTEASRYMLKKIEDSKFKMLSIYPDPESKGFKRRVKGLTDGGWSDLRDVKKWTSEEVMLYHPDYPKQAEAARDELVRRGGYWNLSSAESDIYMARLMGYGESYIIPFMREYYPEFDVDKYIEENPREEFLRKINR